jgi:hypothetical protein
MDPDPHLDPDPAIFVINLQDANRSFSAYYLLFEGTLHIHYFSKIKSQKEVARRQESKFFLLFLLDDRRIRIQISNTVFGKFVYFLQRLRSCCDSSTVETRALFLL